ncbi:MAG: helix-turn-helix transcriptional regulator [Candidatus Cybelea sp.]
MIFDDQKIEGLIARCRLAEASAMLAMEHGASSLRAAIFALAGDDRALARYVAPELLASKSAAEVAAYHAAMRLEPGAYDYLVAGTVLAWASDGAGACDSFRVAHDRAIAQRRFDLAVAARERLAHHALLFGEIDVARTAIEGAIALAQSHHFASWLLRALAAGASLALDAGDLDRAAELLSRGRAAAGSVEDLALFAATGAQLAVELGDDAKLAEWSSTEMVEIALRCERPETAIAATLAGLIAAGAPAPGEPAAIALRRSLLQADGPSSTPELFSIAARYGDLDEARFGVDALSAVAAPERPYLRGHRFLARAHFLLRSGERGGWIDCAGDAARAFTAMGLRRWTNEAMGLLVSQEPGGERRTRGRSGSALTGREEQVAQLIRRGARNREVAAALQISEHTVERHVSSSLGRLGLRSRWQIADSGKHAQD